MSNSNMSESPRSRTGSPGSRTDPPAAEAVPSGAHSSPVLGVLHSAGGQGGGIHPSPQAGRGAEIPGTPMASNSTVQHMLCLLGVTLAAGFAASWGLFCYRWIGFWGFSQGEAAISVAADAHWTAYWDDNLLWLALPFLTASVCASLHLALEKVLHPHYWWPHALASAARSCSWILLSSKRIKGPFTVGSVLLGLTVLVPLAWVAGLYITRFLLEVAQDPKDFHDITVRTFQQVYCIVALGRPLPYLLALVYLPVTRCSSIMRFLRIPFKLAVGYHRTLGFWIVGLTWAHGLLCYTAWIGGTGRFWQKLHLVFFVLVCFHLPGWSPAFLGGLGMFAQALGMDRLIRTHQALHPVDSAEVLLLPDGCASVTLPVAPGASNQLLDTVWLKVPCASRLQWHPLSVVSSPSELPGEMRVMIKPVGQWTQAVAREVGNINEGGDESGKWESGWRRARSLRVMVQGPYGFEYDFLKRYKALLLVAGGMGITSFLSLLSELSSRLKDPSTRAECPDHVLLLWTVRSSSTLAALTESGADLAALFGACKAEGGTAQGAMEACRGESAMPGDTGSEGEGDKPGDMAGDGGARGPMRTCVHVRVVVIGQAVKDPGGLDLECGHVLSGTPTGVLLGCPATGPPSSGSSLVAETDSTLGRSFATDSTNSTLGLSLGRGSFRDESFCDRPAAAVLGESSGGPGSNFAGGTARRAVVRQLGTGSDVAMALAVTVFGASVAVVILLCVALVTWAPVHLLDAGDGDWDSTMDAPLRTAWETLFYLVGSLVGGLLAYGVFKAVDLQWPKVLEGLPECEAVEAVSNTELPLVISAAALGQPGMSVQSGKRPTYKDEIEYMLGLNTKVGVLVSGPAGMECDIARLVQKHQGGFGSSRLTFHSISFEM